jgi:hypothetical protein
VRTYRKAYLGLVRGLAALAASVLLGGHVNAHSASDAFLTLTVKNRGEREGEMTIVQAQWDVALRDLDFMLHLDDNGDGDITWHELRAHQNAIAQYAYRFIHFGGDGRACVVNPTRQLVDYHADGAYAALFFTIVCKAGLTHLTLDYGLFFDVDPSHRGILVMRSGDSVATAVLSPDNSQIQLPL